MTHRRTISRDAGHVQTFFSFLAGLTAPDPPMKPPHLLHHDHPDFSPLPEDVIRIDGFCMHKIHARRLLEVRGDRSLDHWERGIEPFRAIYSCDGDDLEEAHEDEIEPDHVGEI